MKKVLFFLCTIIAVTLFVQPAWATDTYDSTTGILHVPNLIVDGNICYHVMLQKEDGWTFSVDSATEQSCGSDTSDYTTYDSTTGILNAPNVVMDGSTCYAVVLQKGSGWTFSVISATEQSC